MVIVTNSGAEIATSATISDVLPAELAEVAWTCTRSTGAICAVSGSGALNDTVTLPPAGTLTYLLTGTVRSSALGDVVNTIFALPPASYLNVGTGSATDNKPTSTEGDVSVSKATRWFTGVNVITYTILYSNTGPSDAREVLIMDTLPISVTYRGQISASLPIDSRDPIGHDYTWYTPTLPAKPFGSIVFTVTVDPGISGPLFNTIAITSTTLDTNPANNFYQVGVNSRSGTPAAVQLASFEARHHQRQHSQRHYVGNGERTSQPGL